jgi:PAS domain S-box-containing protein
MKKNPGIKEQLLGENEDLRRRLEEAEETLRAIHEGEVDALVLSKPQGEVVFTLKGAESPYRVFVEEMNEGAVTLDHEGTILYCNNRFSELLKIPTEKVVGSPIRRFIPPEDSSGFESAFREGKLQNSTIDISLQKEDQELIPVHLSFTMLPEQDIPIVCMVVMDRTEHKRMEIMLRALNANLEKRVKDRAAELLKVNKTLRAEIVERKQAEQEIQKLLTVVEEEKDRLSALVKSISDEVWFANTQERFTLANPAALSEFGLGLADGMNVKKFAECLEVHRPDGSPRPVEEAPPLRALQGEVVKNQEEIVRIPRTGELRFRQVSAAPVRDTGGYIIGSVSVVRDITEHKRADEALQKRTFELQQLTESLEQKVKERTAELEKANKTLQEISLRLLSAHEEERKRLAGEIHDSIASCLNAVKYKIDILQQIGKESNITAEALISVIPVIQEGIEECRRMQQDLRPSMLDDLGLLATLSWFCRRYQTIYTGIKVELEQTLEEKDIPDSLKIVFFRVIQEGMNNIAKHSKGDLAHLSLQKKNGRIELVLEDNGRGFDLGKVLGVETTKRGFGLTSMKERTELSGGSFAIESVEGKGTTIRASWAC